MIEILKVNYSDIITNVEELKKYYEFVKPFIKKRMMEFNSFHDADKVVLFKELAFCILTANASAKMGLKAIEVLDTKVFYDDEKEIEGSLRGIYRFPKSRASYIVRSRTFLECFDLDLRKVFNKYELDPFMLRNFLRDNIVGFGYKECSHFLRNVGYKGFAILDKHINA